MSALATVVQKSFNGKVTAKIDFLIGHFMYPLLTLKSLQTLFDKYLDHVLVKFEQKHIVRTKFCGFWQKMVNNFWQSIDAILEDVLVTETIVWC